MSDRFALAIHGGAGPRATRDDEASLANLRATVERGRDMLAGGAAALDVAAALAADLEAAGLYVAGRGASPNRDGVFELDACLMDGTTARVGSVAALVGYRSPIAAARAVMEETPHAMLAGGGAAAFAAARGLAPVGDPAAWFTPAGRSSSGASTPAHGTIGCVVRDREGRLAAATSTGGTFGKLPGRVGDSPLAGAGAWADCRVAVSCTGLGEFFIRTAAAVQVAHRMRWAGADVSVAAEAAIDEVAALGGEGGLIAIDSDGRIAMPFNSEGMKRAALHPDGTITVDVV